jgi:beta-lactamase superfamily II metal-dependent hydrolase
MIYLDFQLPIFLMRKNTKRKPLLLLLLLMLFTVGMSGAQQGKALPEWKEGYLDIHFISTGVGNCAFAVLPDGTSLLIDAGELDPTSPRVLSPRNTRRFPDYSKLGFQWQADYILSMFPKGRTPVLDYALISHFHDDHFGGMYPGIPKSEKGNYFLSGIAGVGDIIPIRKLIDRGYDYPYDLKSLDKRSPDHLESLRNLWNFTSWHGKESGLVHEKLIVGSDKQITLKYNAAKFPGFSVRNINANGEVWSGEEGKPNTNKLPDLETIKRTGIVPGENPLSCGIRIQYGDFTFYTSGDIPGTQADFEKMPEWYDMERSVAPVVGEVDVATANHHANRDAMTPYYLSVLKPKVIIQEVWSSDHPGHEALIRMTSKKIWSADRDLFATNMLDANRLVIGDLLEKSYKSTQGHVVLRVMPDGGEYFLYVLNNMDTSRHITGVFGPYTSK